MKNGRHSKEENCRQVTITKFNMQRERGGVRRGRRGGGGCKGGRRRGREKEEGPGEDGVKLPTTSSEAFP